MRYYHAVRDSGRFAQAFSPVMNRILHQLNLSDFGDSPFVRVLNTTSPKNCHQTHARFPNGIQVFVVFDPKIFGGAGTKGCSKQKFLPSHRSFRNPEPFRFFRDLTGRERDFSGSRFYSPTFFSFEISITSGSSASSVFFADSGSIPVGCATLRLKNFPSPVAHKLRTTSWNR